MSDDMHHIPTNIDDTGLPAEAKDDFRLLVQFLKYIAQNAILFCSRAGEHFT